MSFRLSKAVVGAIAASFGISALIGATPAHADGGYPPVAGAPCTTDQLGQVYYGDPILRSRTTVTAFTPIRVAAGTTGTHTTTLTHMANASTTETDSQGTSISATANFNIIIAKASATATQTFNYSTSTTIGSADTTSVSMTWNFTQPGYYGLYQGTHIVSGLTQLTTCVMNAYPNVPIGWQIVDHYYTTYSPIEEGTVVCDNNVPDPDLNVAPVSDVAKQMLGHC